MSKVLIKILVVDDHGMMREGLKMILSNLDGIHVIGEASTGEEALKLTRKLKPNVVLMDLQMPGMGGVEAASRLMRANPDAKILVFSAFSEEPFPSRMMQAGCSGYITKKECTPHQMTEAIRVICAGDRYISPSIAQQLAMKHVGKSSGKSTDDPFEKLSTREVQVMEMIVKGMKAQQVAELLCLSPKTVNSYRYRLFNKLGVKSDVELTRLALRYGLSEDVEVLDDDQ